VVNNKANSRVFGKHNSTPVGASCFQFSWEAYGSGGVILDLLPSFAQSTNNAKFVPVKLNAVIVLKVVVV